MANRKLDSDKVARYRIEIADQHHVRGVLPAGNIYTVTSSVPDSLRAEIGTMADNSPAIVLTPLVPDAEGVEVTLTDSAGSDQVSFLIDVVSNRQVLAIELSQPELTRQQAPQGLMPTKATPVLELY